MFRYCVELYSGRVFTTKFNSNELLSEPKFIQLLGFEDSKHNAFGYYDLESLDLNKLKGSKLLLINFRGLVKRPSARVKRVWKEKL